MKDKNRISVIVPVYNVQDHIAECLDSIVKQTHKPYEVILVNDGSTDNSPDICKKYSGHYPFIKITNQENKGLSAARNTGIDRATGEYICFIDSDDFVAENMLSVLHEKILETGADMVKCGILHYYNESRIDKYCGIDSGFIVLENKSDFFKALFAKKYTHSACNALYKRELFDSLRFMEGKIAEDLYLAPHLLMKCKKMVIVSEWLYFYRKRDGSIMNSFDFKHYDILEACLLMKTMLEHHDLFDSLADDFFSWFSHHLSAFAKSAAKHTSFLQYRKHLNVLHRFVSYDDINRIIDTKKRLNEHEALTKQEKIKNYKAYHTLINIRDKPNKYWLKIRYNDMRKK